ncbi:MAG: methionine adenosyltransferase [Micrococcaceae bacterium]
MTSEIKLFTSESVTEGHPDKICDQISDAILDAVLEQDSESRVAVETVVTKGLVHVVGEMDTKGYVEIPSLVRQTIKEIGYDSPKLGFASASCGVSISIGPQSPEIADGVFESSEARNGEVEDEYDEQGAGDQGIMFGYASNETRTLMPLPIWSAHRLAEQLSKVRKAKKVDFFRPDGKTQVTIAYQDGKPVAVDTIVISTQHDEDISKKQLEDALHEHVIAPVLALEEFKDIDTDNIEYILNPSGEFVLGGPQGDAGLTGRKIIVDTYGGMARHGGGAFSGKDPSKVDRSAAYALRWVAKNVVAAGFADKVEVQIAYAIGQARPVGLYVDTFDTGKVPSTKIQEAIEKVFDLRPKAIIEALDLKKPQYYKTAAYGHFGREYQGFAWEETNKVDELKAYLG